MSGAHRRCRISTGQGISFAARSSFAKPVPKLCLQIKAKGGGAPTGATVPWGLATPTDVATCSRFGRGRASRRDALASRRSTAVLARLLPLTQPGPRFLESPGANGRTLPGASAASSSRTGHSAGRAGPQGRPGAVCETARGHRTRPASSDRIRNAPFDGRVDCIANQRTWRVKGE